MKINETRVQQSAKNVVSIYFRCNFRFSDISYNMKHFCTNRCVVRFNTCVTGIPFFGRLLLFYWRQVHLLWRQIRCIFDIYESLGLRKWTKVTFVNGGTSYTYYWGLFRIQTAQYDSVLMIYFSKELYGVYAREISPTSFTPEFIITIFNLSKVRIG